MTSNRRPISKDVLSIEDWCYGRSHVVWPKSKMGEVPDASRISRVERAKCRLGVRTPRLSLFFALPRILDIGKSDDSSILCGFDLLDCHISRIWLAIFGLIVTFDCDIWIMGTTANEGISVLNRSNRSILAFSIDLICSGRREIDRFDRFDR